MTWDDHTQLDAAVQRILARSEHRLRQYRRLGGNGVRKPIKGGCGEVRVNGHGQVLAVELDLAGARAAGERRLSAWVLDALRGAHAQAQRINRLIADS